MSVVGLQSPNRLPLTVHSVATWAGSWMVRPRTQCDFGGARNRSVTRGARTVEDDSRWPIVGEAVGELARLDVLRAVNSDRTLPRVGRSSTGVEYFVPAPEH